MYFSNFIKTKFNSAQKNIPNIIKFVKTNIQNIYLFHISLIRELDGAFKVIDTYNFTKNSKLEAIDLEKEKSTPSDVIFKKDDVLLFELKDSTIENIALRCLYHNYESINGYVKLLKETEEFKDSTFYYIGIQEKKESEKYNYR